MVSVIHKFIIKVSLLLSGLLSFEASSVSKVKPTITNLVDADGLILFLLRTSRRELLTI